MQVFYYDDQPPPADRRPAVTLGVFDGVHLGHRKIIAALRETARETAAPTLAVTFAQHPRLTLGRSAPPFITSLENRLTLLADAGVDAVWVLDFCHELAILPGREFAGEYLHRRLAASAVVMGEAARFGNGRDGDAATLTEWAKEWDMRVVTVPPLFVDGVRVSSTAVRLAVQSGDLERARAFLGRRFSVIGTVVHGQGLAKGWGFPTLNLDPHHELRPPAGVYLTEAAVAGHIYPSVTNVGRPPTDAEIQAGLGDFMVETHLLGFDGDLYGSVAEVFFIEKMRDVMRFAETDGLVRQVRDDLAAARRRFGKEAGGGREPS